MLIAARERLQTRLDQLHDEHGFVGATAAFVVADGGMGVAASGFADLEREILMTPDHRMPAGSIGKTIAGMTAFSMVAEGLLTFDDRAKKWLGGEPWFDRLANHDEITLRQLLSHSAGVIDHVYEDDWWHEAHRRRSGPNADPDSYFTPRESVGFILDKPALFPAGEGYHYTDTGLIVAGLMLEAASGGSFHDEAQRRLLDPLGLTLTEAQNKRDFAGLASGYMGEESLVGIPHKVADQGVLEFNPRSEWTGGGYVSNPQDLARWAKLIYEEEALETPYLGEMLSSGYRGEDTKAIYGITVFITDNEVGRILGHGGQYPGYRSSMYYHPEARLAIALQVNQYEPDVHNILRQELFEDLLEVVR